MNLLSTEWVPFYIGMATCISFYIWLYNYMGKNNISDDELMSRILRGLDCIFKYIFK
jgi:hypothetical protein